MNFATAISEGHILVWARKARANGTQMWAAIVLVIAYLFIGVMDVVSTGAALHRGATEVNPFMSWLQSFDGSIWIQVRLFLQTFVSGMILFYPHRTVLTIFAIMVAVNGVAVCNNWLVLSTLF